MAGVEFSDEEQPIIIHGRRREPEFTTIRELYRDLPYAETIKDSADAFYGKIIVPCVSFKEENRRIAAFYCLYMTLLNQPDSAVPPGVLARKMGLNPKRAGTHLCTMAKFDVECPIVIATPTKFVRSLLTELAVSADDHYMTCRKVVEKISPELRDKLCPQNIALGGVFYQLNRVAHLDITKAIFASRFEVSVVTIDKAAKAAEKVMGEMA